MNIELIKDNGAFSGQKLLSLAVAQSNLNNTYGLSPVALVCEKEDDVTYSTNIMNDVYPRSSLNIIPLSELKNLKTVDTVFFLRRRMSVPSFRYMITRIESDVRRIVSTEEHFEVTYGG